MPYQNKGYKIWWGIDIKEAWLLTIIFSLRIHLHLSLKLLCQCFQLLFSLRWSVPRWRCHLYAECTVHVTRGEIGTGWWRAAEVRGRSRIDVLADDGSVVAWRCGVCWHNVAVDLCTCRYVWSMVGWWLLHFCLGWQGRSWALLSRGARYAHLLLQLLRQCCQLLLSFWGTTMFWWHHIIM